MSANGQGSSCAKHEEYIERMQKRGFPHTQTSSWKLQAKLSFLVALKEEIKSLLMKMMTDMFESYKALTSGAAAGETF